jgi:hypothetical protein
MQIRLKFFLLVIYFLPNLLLAQEGSWRELRRPVGKELIQLDTLSIYPNTFVVKNGEITLSEKEFFN